MPFQYAAVCMTVTLKLCYLGGGGGGHGVGVGENMFQDNFISELFTHDMCVYRIFPLLSACAYISKGRKPALNSEMHLTNLQVHMRVCGHI